ncbi:MAG: DUF4956 domain-containing protein [Clostridia bacterium]|nr:DUF4956 domain-containing protein [Clostridia bacterium]
MMDKFFKGVFDDQLAAVIDIKDFLICLAAALVCGMLLAFAYSFKSRYTKSFVVTLALIPAVVCMVIMLVNGNIGTGVAIAGAFSLVRFRSVPGSAKEIGVIFLAMGAGLANGMGYLGFALLFTVILGVAFMLLNLTAFGESKRQLTEKTLRITIPEDLDYTGIFDDIFEKYTNECKVTGVRTTNMGSLFRLTYDIELKKGANEKEFIDELRTRNGNLEISISLRQAAQQEL